MPAVATTKTIKKCISKYGRKETRPEHKDDDLPPFAYITGSKKIITVMSYVAFIDIYKKNKQVLKKYAKNKRTYTNTTKQYSTDRAKRMVDNYNMLNSPIATKWVGIDKTTPTSIVLRKYNIGLEKILIRIEDNPKDPKTSSKPYPGTVLKSGGAGDTGVMCIVPDYAEWKSLPGYDGKSEEAHTIFIEEFDRKGDFYDARLHIGNKLNHNAYRENLLDVMKKNEFICGGPKKDNSLYCPNEEYLQKKFDKANTLNEKRLFISDNIRGDHGIRRIDGKKFTSPISYCSSRDNPYITTRAFNIGNKSLSKEDFDNQCFTPRCYACDMVVSVEERGQQLKNNSVWRQKKDQQLKAQGRICYGDQMDGTGKCCNQEYLEEKLQEIEVTSDGIDVDRQNGFILNYLRFCHPCWIDEIDSDDPRLSKFELNWAIFANDEIVFDEKGVIRCWECDSIVTAKERWIRLMKNRSSPRYWDVLEYFYHELHWTFPERPRVQSFVDVPTKNQYKVDDLLQVEFNVEGGTTSTYCATLEQYYFRTVIIKNVTYPLHTIIYDADDASSLPAKEDVIFFEDGSLLQREPNGEWDATATLVNKQRYIHQDRGTVFLNVSCVSEAGAILVTTAANDNATSRRLSIINAAIDTTAADADADADAAASTVGTTARRARAHAIANQPSAIELEITAAFELVETYADVETNPAVVWSDKEPAPDQNDVDERYDLSLFPFIDVSVLQSDRTIRKAVISEAYYRHLVTDFGGLDAMKSSDCGGMGDEIFIMDVGIRYEDTPQETKSVKLFRLLNPVLQEQAHTRAQPSVDAAAAAAVMITLRNSNGANHDVSALVTVSPPNDGTQERSAADVLPWKRLSSPLHQNPLSKRRREH